MAKTIGLIGNYGWGNFGDELLLKVILNELEEKGHNVIIFSMNPKHTSKIYPCKEIIMCAGRSSFSVKAIKKIKKMDLLIFGGGGIMNDYYKSTPKWVFFWHTIANLFRVPVGYFGIGVGPISTNFGRNVYQKIIKRSIFISVRDNYSVNQINLICPKKEVFLSYDGVFLLKFDLNKENKSRSRIIVSLRDWPFYENISLCLGYISAALLKFRGEFEDSNPIITFVNFEKKDEKITQTLSEELSISFEVEKYDAENLDVVLSLFSNSILTIGMRYHSLVISSLMNCPFIGIAYDPKVTSIVQKFEGDEALIQLNDEFREKLDKAFVWYFANLKNIKNKLNYFVTIAKDDVKKCFNLLLDSQKLIPLEEIEI